MSNELNREFGELKGSFKSLESSVNRLANRVESLECALTDHRIKTASFKGSISTKMALVCGSAIFVLTFLGTVIANKI